MGCRLRGRDGVLLGGVLLLDAQVRKRTARRARQGWTQRSRRRESVSHETDFGSLVEIVILVGAFFLSAAVAIGAAYGQFFSEALKKFVGRNRDKKR